mgnify:CR=1 FL=1
MTPKKYKPEANEKKIEFVARIVTSEDRPMTAAEVCAHIDKRSMKSMNPKNIHANLSDSAGKYNLLGKTRMISGDGKKRVNYHPVGMVVEGEDIAVPYYTKEGGNTFVNEEQQTEEPTGVLTLDEDGMLQHKPDAVKVAEQVLADLGASDDDDDGLRTLLTNEPIPRTDDDDDDDDDDLFSQPLILQVLAEYHMTTVDIVKARISHHIMTARTTEDNRALFDILKEMMA